MRRYSSTLERFARKGRVRPPRRVAALFGWSTAVMLVLSVGAVVAYGAIKVTGTVNHGLVAVGPTSGENGFPVWYKDSKGVRIEPCIDVADPNCAAGAPLPNPDAPMSFPDNFPDEMFYQLADNVLTDAANPALRAKSMFNLEGAFVNGDPAPGDQMVFGRIRYQWKGMKPDTTFRVTHPYGVDEVTSDAAGAVFETEDPGATGGFGEALNSRLGPFLKSTTAPAGYLGDGATVGPITGSPLVDAGGQPQNYVRIQSLGANGQPDGAVDLKSTDFTIMGKLATTAGVNVDSATYSRPASGPALLDVFASSESGPQSIQVSGDGVVPTTLRGENGHYIARAKLTGTTIPKTVTVTNVGDVPASVKTATVTDAVTATAAYDADASTLTITASSSDAVSAPTLTATDYGALSGSPLVVHNVSGPPPTITVTSSAGGKTTVPVTLSGAGFAGVPVVAVAGADQEAVSGAGVTLDGSSSTGPVATFAWSQTAGPAVTLQGANAAKATFSAPTVTTGSVTLTFELNVTSADGSSSTNTVDVVVQAPGSTPNAGANAGPDQTAAQGATVTLDGSGSTAAKTFSWRQTAGTPVTLTGATTAKPTFTFPKMDVTDTTKAPLTFELTATGAVGTSPTTDTVTVTAPADRVTLSRNQFTRSTNEWRVEGNSTVFGPGVRISIYMGRTVSPATLLATADVDTLGAFKYREANVAAARRATTVASFGNPPVVTLVSSSGGRLAAQPVSVK